MREEAERVAEREVERVAADSEGVETAVEREVG